jgi:hypothetical protein
MARKAPSPFVDALQTIREMLGSIRDILDEQSQDERKHLLHELQVLSDDPGDLAIVTCGFLRQIIGEIGNRTRAVTQFAHALEQAGMDLYVPARLAAYLTNMALPNLNRLCKSGAVRGRNPSGHGRRLEVHLADLARYIERRDRF